MIQIRVMTIDHYEEVYELWKSTGSIQLKKSDELKEIQRMIERNPDTCLIGVVEDRIVAAVMGGFDGRRGMIHHLAVDPTEQGKGYGRLMLEELECRFTEMGVIKLNLFVVDTNEKVISFYEKLGYIQRPELVPMSKTLLEEF